jgi:hypothetical protein
MNRRNFIKTTTILGTGLLLVPDILLSKNIDITESHTIFDVMGMEGWRYKKRLNGLGSMYEVWHPVECLTGRLWCWGDDGLRPMSLYVDESVPGAPVQYPITYTTTPNDSGYVQALTELRKALRKAKQVDGWNGVSKCIRDQEYRLEEWEHEYDLNKTSKTALHFTSQKNGILDITYYNNAIQAPGGADYRAHWYFEHRIPNGYTYKGWSKKCQDLLTWLRRER